MKKSVFLPFSATICKIIFCAIKISTYLTSKSLKNVIGYRRTSDMNPTSWVVPSHGSIKVHRMRFHYFYPPRKYFNISIWYFKIKCTSLDGGRLLNSTLWIISWYRVGGRYRLTPVRFIPRLMCGKREVGYKRNHIWRLEIHCSPEKQKLQSRPYYSNALPL